ncbi:MAG: Sip1-related alpha-galactosidase, partial [Verrucomicrobiota bacterium]
ALAELRDGGVSPGFVVLDNGWSPSTNDTFISYHADLAKFPGGLRDLVRSLKTDYDVRQVLMWQAYNGYWRGADPAALPGIGIEMVQPSLPAASPNSGPAGSQKKFYPGGYRQPIGEPDLNAFYAKFHRNLRDDGVDGVKVDAMAWIETLGEGRGGRVQAMRDLVKATARSEHDFFHGNVIWCSSCSSDCILQAPRSALMRSSGDFDPGKQVSQGRHVAANAQNSLWMGEFVIPDWDMFQSDSAAGAFHAAARAISGGPVYIADELGKTDFSVLRELVLSDGSVPLCLEPGKPAPDSLFADPLHGRRLFKIFNHNPAGGAVIGLFNCAANGATNQSLDGVATLADVPDLAGTNFAAFRHQSGSLQRLNRAGELPILLPALGFELVTLAPITDGFAAIGLADKFNSGGCVTAVRHVSAEKIEVDLRDGGQFVAWAERAPDAVTADGRSLAFRYDTAAKMLRVTVPEGKPVRLRIKQPGDLTLRR